MIVITAVSGTAIKMYCDADFIQQYTGKVYPEGNFVDKYGKILGKHKGIIRYTVGQRKGLGIAFQKPLYVSKVNPSDNTVTLAEEKELYTKTFKANNINLISVTDIKNPMHLNAKIRYRQKEQPASVIQQDENTLKIEFDEPQRAVTKGQAVVLYDNDIVVGGGTII